MISKDLLEQISKYRQTVTLSVPLIIRCLEWAREEAKDDVALHKMVENMIAKNRVIDTDDYDCILPK
jgi:hypothetical protein